MRSYELKVPREPCLYKLHRFTRFKAIALASLVHRRVKDHIWLHPYVSSETLHLKWNALQTSFSGFGQSRRRVRTHAISVTSVKYMNAYTGQDV